VQEEDNSDHYPTLALNKEAHEASVSSTDQKKSYENVIR
jgi:hypothetical protein